MKLFSSYLKPISPFFLRSNISDFLILLHIVTPDVASIDENDTIQYTNRFPDLNKKFYIEKVQSIIDTIEQTEII